METATAHISRRCRPIIASAVIASALLASVAARTPAASGTPSVGAQFTQTRAVAHRRSVRPAYGWPVKPFNRQHPVRANLNDPRNGHGDAKSFHFGIDITDPVGAAVYAVEGGKVFLTRGRMAVAVVGSTSTFGYWHVKPAVRNHQIVRLHQLLGHVIDEGGGAHVHFAERSRGNGLYLNPLRPGGIGPYVDRTPPRVATVEFLHARTRSRRQSSHRPRGHRRRDLRHGPDARAGAVVAHARHAGHGCAGASRTADGPSAPSGRSSTRITCCRAGCTTPSMRPARLRTGSARPATTASTSLAGSTPRASRPASAASGSTQRTRVATAPLRESRFRPPRLASQKPSLDGGHPGGGLVRQRVLRETRPYTASLPAR